MYYITTKSNATFELLGETASRSDARIMAKELGGTVRTDSEYQILSAARAAGTPVADEAPIISVAPIGSEIIGDVHDYTCPHCHISLTNGVGGHGDEVNGKTIKHDAYEYACLGCGGEFGPAIPAKADKKAPGKKAPGKKIPHTTESTVERPCKLVWQIADDVHAASPTAKRGDVLTACVVRGVAYFTARTQYQQWLTVQKEMAAREAAQASK